MNKYAKIKIRRYYRDFSNYAEALSSWRPEPQAILPDLQQHKFRGVRTSMVNSLTEAHRLARVAYPLKVIKELNYVLSQKEIEHIVEVCDKTIPTYKTHGNERLRLQHARKYFSTALVSGSAKQKPSSDFVLAAYDQGTNPGYTKSRYSNVVALQAGLSDEELVNEMVRHFGEDCRDKVVALEVHVVRRRVFEKTVKYELTE